jgi:hypothetical protein
MNDSGRLSATGVSNWRNIQPLPNATDYVAQPRVVSFAPKGALSLVVQNLSPTDIEDLAAYYSAIEISVGSVCRFSSARALPSPTIKAVSATADATRNFRTNLLGFLVIFCNASRTLTCLRTRQSDPRTTFVNAVEQNSLCQSDHGIQVVRNAPVKRQAERQRSIFRTKSSMMRAKGEARDGR